MTAREKASELAYQEGVNDRRNHRGAEPPIMWVPYDKGTQQYYAYVRGWNWENERIFTNGHQD